MSSETYTCLTCHVSFKDGDLQRQHHKSDWHWYNLKRKVVSLPPLTPDQFKDKVLEQQQTELNNNLCQQFYCPLCKKRFNSENSYNSHKRSKKHVQLADGSEDGDSVISQSNSLTEKERERVLSNEKEVISETTSTQEESEEWEFEGLCINECLFCCHWSQNMEKNLKHMTSSHSFFIPDAEFLSDLQGFITYLGVKVGADYECLKCGTEGREYRSIEAVQKHMVDKGHSIINTEGQAYLEYSDYYDFSGAGVNMLGGDFDVVEGAEEVVRDISLKVDDNMCLVLPTGARVGHRSMRIYYKQNLSIEERSKRNNTARIELLRNYRAIGWYNGQQGKLKLKDEKRANMMRQKDRTRLAVKANKFQTYFRPQVIF